MTETSRAVDNGSHAENNVVRIARGSRERVICSGRAIFNDFVIFSVIAGSLHRLELGLKNNCLRLDI